MFPDFAPPPLGGVVALSLLLVSMCLSFPGTRVTGVGEHVLGVSQAVGPLRNWDATQISGMHRERLCLLTCIVLALVGLLVTSCPDRNRQPRGVAHGETDAGTLGMAGAPIDAGQARKLADPVAREEISRVEAEHRKDDPSVTLAWEDYEVTVAEKPEHFVVFYQYSNPDPGFELWAGHGMHFSVYVDRKTGETRMVGGE